MPFRLPTSRDLRRLLSACLTMSVLLTTLGWAHPPCGAAAGHVGAVSSVTEHEAAPGTPASHEPCDGAPRDAGAGRPGQDGRHAPPASGCMLVAHCAAALVTAVSAAPAPRAPVAARPAVESAARPLGPSYQPDSPPPKV